MTQMIDQPTPPTTPNPPTPPAAAPPPPPMGFKMDPPASAPVEMPSRPIAKPTPPVGTQSPAPTPSPPQGFTIDARPSTTAPGTNEPAPATPPQKAPRVASPPFGATQIVPEDPWKQTLDTKSLPNATTDAVDRDYRFARAAARKETAHRVDVDPHAAVQGVWPQYAKGMRETAAEIEKLSHGIEFRLSSRDSQDYGEDTAAADRLRWTAQTEHDKTAHFRVEEMLKNGLHEKTPAAFHEAVMEAAHARTQLMKTARALALRGEGDAGSTMTKELANRDAAREQLGQQLASYQMSPETSRVLSIAQDPSSVGARGTIIKLTDSQKQELVRSQAANSAAQSNPQIREINGELQKALAVSEDSTLSKSRAIHAARQVQNLSALLSDLYEKHVSNIMLAAGYKSGTSSAAQAMQKYKQGAASDMNVFERAAVGAVSGVAEGTNKDVNLLLNPLAGREEQKRYVGTNELEEAGQTIAEKYPLSGGIPRNVAGMARPSTIAMIGVTAPMGLAGAGAFGVGLKIRDTLEEEGRFPTTGEMAWAGTTNVAAIGMSKVLGRLAEKMPVFQKIAQTIPPKLLEGIKFIGDASSTGLGMAAINAPEKIYRTGHYTWDDFTQDYFYGIAIHGSMSGMDVFKRIHEAGPNLNIEQESFAKKWSAAKTDEDRRRIIQEAVGQSNISFDMPDLAKNPAAPVMTDEQGKLTRAGATVPGATIPHANPSEEVARSETPPPPPPGFKLDAKPQKEKGNDEVAGPKKVPVGEAPDGGGRVREGNAQGSEAATARERKPVGEKGKGGKGGEAGVRETVPSVSPTERERTDREAKSKEAESLRKEAKEPVKTGNPPPSPVNEHPEGRIEEGEPATPGEAPVTTAKVEPAETPVERTETPRVGVGDKGGLEPRGTSQQPKGGGEVGAGGDKEPTTFKTSKGSAYTVDAEGRTTRNKAPHAGHDAADVGPKDRSDRTVYMSPEDSTAIGAHGTISGRKAIIERDGKLYAATWNEAEEKWGLSPTEKAGRAFSEMPRRGLAPVELWGKEGDQWGKWHAGNEITEMGAPATSVKKNPGLPDWVNEAMIASGKNPNRLLNEIDVSHRDIAENLKNDPVAKWLEKNDPKAAERFKKGEFSAHDYLDAQRQMNEEKPLGDSKYGADNKIVTREGYEAALRELGNPTLYSGLPASKLAALARIGAYHIEAGARSFVEFSDKMIRQFGDKIHPHLANIYSAIRRNDEYKGLHDLMDRGAGIVTSGEALTASLKSQEAASIAGYTSAQQEAAHNLAGTIRGMKWEVNNAAEFQQAVRDELAQRQKELPPSVAQQFSADVGRAKSPEDYRQAVKRMQKAMGVYGLPEPEMKAKIAEAKRNEEAATKEGTKAVNDSFTNVVTTPNDTVPVSDAIKASMNAKAAGFREGQTTDTPAEANARITNTIAPPETKIGINKAIRASMEIRAKAEAAIKGLEDTAELRQNVKDELAEAAKEYPKALRGDLINAMRDAKTPLDLRKALDRMDESFAAWKKGQALNDLYDTTGKPTKERGPSGDNLRQKVDESLGVAKPKEPFAKGQVDPDKLQPEHRDAVSPLINAIRKGNTIDGAKTLADFLQTKTDEGRSNAFTPEQLAELSKLDGKKKGELLPEQTELLKNAIAHTQHLSDETNSAIVGSKIRQLKDAGDAVVGAMLRLHPKMLTTEKGVGDKGLATRILGDVQRDMSRLTRLNGGEEMEKAIYTPLAKGESDALLLFHHGQDALKAVRQKHKVGDFSFIRMGQKQEAINLPNGQTINMTPRERMYFMASWGDLETRKAMMDGSPIILKRFAGQTGRNVRVTSEIADAIMNTATPFERDYLAAGAGFLHTNLADAINTASIRGKGFEVATNPDYFPRHRDAKQTFQKVLPENVQSWLENSGSLKERTGGRAPIIIGDYHDEYTDHTDTMSRYANLAEPVRDILMLTSNAQNGVGIGQDIDAQLGKSFNERLVQYMAKVSGVTKDSQFLHGTLSAMQGAIAVGELGLRPTSIINHWLGGSLFANDLHGWEYTDFLKEAANPKNLFDATYYKRMGELSGYFRQRSEQHGAGLVSPPAGTGIETLSHSRVGMAVKKVGNLSLMGLKYGDARDIVTLGRTLERSYMRDHPDASPEEAFKNATERAEYIVRRNGTTSSPLDQSYLNLRLKQIPGGGVLSLFSSKANKIRNAADEAIQNFRQNPSTDTGGKLIKAAALAGFNALAVATVRSFFSQQRQGFPVQSSQDEDKAKRSKVVELLAELADQFTQGTGVIVRSVNAKLEGRPASDGNILTSTLNDVFGKGYEAVDSWNKNKKEAATIKALQSISAAGKLVGIPIDAPLGIAVGVYKQSTAKPTTPALRLAQQLRTHITNGQELSADARARFDLKNRLADLVHEHGGVTPEIRDELNTAVGDGKLHRDDVKDIQSQAKMGELPYAIHRLSPEPAAQVYADSKTTPAEKKEIGSAVANKIANSRLSPKDQDALFAKYKIAPPTDIDLVREHTSLNQEQSLSPELKKEAKAIERALPFLRAGTQEYKDQAARLKEIRGLEVKAAPNPNSPEAKRLAVLGDYMTSKRALEASLKDGNVSNETYDQQSALAEARARKALAAL